MVLGYKCPILSELLLKPTFLSLGIVSFLTLFKVTSIYPYTIKVLRILISKVI